MHDRGFACVLQQLVFHAHGAQWQLPLSRKCAVGLDLGDNDLGLGPMGGLQRTRGTCGKRPVNGGRFHFRVPDRPATNGGVHGKHFLRRCEDDNLLFKLHADLQLDRCTSPSHRHWHASRAKPCCAQVESCSQALSRRLTLTGWGVRSSCAKKLTRSSSSSQRNSCMRSSTAPLRSATRRQ